MPKGGGLLEHFLQHEMGIAPLFGSGHVPGNFKHFLLYRRTIMVQYFHALFAQNRYFHIVQQVNPLGMVKYGGDVRRYEVFAAADAYYKRAVLSYRHQFIRLVRAYYPQREGPLQPFHALYNRLHKVPFIEMVYEVGYHLGIGIRPEFVPFIAQPFPKGHKVFYYAIVYNGYIPAGTCLGMGIHIRRFAVGGPPGMPDP